MEDNNNEDQTSSSPPSFFKRKPFFVNKDAIRDKLEEEESDFATTTLVKDLPPPTKEKSVSPEITKALEEARALKERAEKERLEAERMSTTLLLDKVASLEMQLEKLEKSKQRVSTDVDDEAEKEQKSNEKKATEVKAQILNLKRQLNGEAPKPPKPTIETVSRTSIDVEASNGEVAEDMPKDLYDKRVGAYKSFSPAVRSLFARATLVKDENDADTIIRKAYVVEQAKKRDGNTAPMDLLDLANAQAGYETLPPAIQNMVVEIVGLDQETNATVIVEKMIEDGRVTRTEDGGVEFSMNEDPEKEEDRGSDREFTMAEIEDAKKLYEGLPAPMKVMLAQSVGAANDANTTAIVEKMIEEKKLLPAEDGVEFVVFGNADQGSLDLGELGDLETAAYVKSVLPSIVTRDENTPSAEDVDAFFSEVLSQKTFNPTNKPEKIPGGYIIRGENKLDSGEALVSALEKSLDKSSVAGRLNFYYMKDPTPATEEEFERDLFELPVLVVSGTNLFPTTNRFVKPGVTALGGLSIASFAVAVCLATDLNMNLDYMEELTGPIVFAIISTQIAHEMAHQIVGLKDKVISLSCRRLSIL